MMFDPEAVGKWIAKAIVIVGASLSVIVVAVSLRLPPEWTCYFVGSAAMLFARQSDVIDARDQAVRSIAKAKKELNEKQCKELSRFLRVISTAMKGMTLFPLGTAQGQQVWTEFLDSLFAEKDRLIKERNELMESSDGPNATTKDSNSKPMLRSGGMQQSDISLAKHDR